MADLLPGSIVHPEEHEHKCSQCQDPLEVGQLCARCFAEAQEAVRKVEIFSLYRLPTGDTR